MEKQKEAGIVGINLSRIPHVRRGIEGVFVFARLHTYLSWDSLNEA